MKNYRIVKKYYKSGKMEELQHRFVIEENREVGWFKKQMKWVTLREDFATEYGVFTADTLFKTESEAREYIYNKMTPLPEPEVIDTFMHIPYSGTSPCPSKN